MAMGTYPEVSLKEARQKRDNTRKIVASGLDPAIEKKQQQILIAQEVETAQGAWYQRKKPLTVWIRNNI